MRSSVVLIAPLSFVPFVPTRNSAENPLPKDYGVSIIKADLEKYVFIAKTVTSHEVVLDVSPEVLIQMKKAAVSSAVLDAMIRRSGDSYSASTGLVTNEEEYVLMSIAWVESSTHGLECDWRSQCAGPS